VVAADDRSVAPVGEVTMEQLDPFLRRAHIAGCSMEIALRRTMRRSAGLAEIG